ncbi:MAG: hypothetical protein K0S28_2111, partial [Paucimonas sp.]|nr:hypothetical protein [Paucimonas sp.]
MNQSGQSQVINQTTSKAIIDWRSFSIGAGNSVRFNQPDSSSIVLNRVVGGNPSSILGNLSANGQVFLVNPFGVYFGANASVDVGGILATTMNIRNEDFMKGNFVFSRDAAAARRDVINAGVLKAREGGYVVLAGDYAANSGVVQARLGTAALASGSKLTLDIAGDNLINLAVNDKTLAELAGVDNSGQLLADGGRAIMTASVARELAGTVVNNSGVVQARSAEERDGVVILSGTGGATQVSGTLDASGKAPGLQGGSIQVVGDKVSLTGSAMLDASGDAGGGNINVGGSFQGTGPLANARTTDVGKEVKLNADALGNGNGGNVVVWSDELTNYAGSISAQGGTQGGDGGNVEVSGKALLNYQGTVTTAAAKGKTGNLLLDPVDIQVLNPSAIAATPPTGVSQMTVGSLETALNANNVTLQTSAGSGAPDGGTITIDDGTGGGVQWTAATTLKLQADNKIVINSTVEGYNGSIVLQAPNGAVQKAGTVLGAQSLMATGGGNWDLAGVGSSGTVNSYNKVNTLAANITGSSIFRFANDKS